MRIIFRTLSLAIFTIEGIFLYFPIKDGFVYSHPKDSFYKFNFFINVGIQIIYYIFALVNVFGLGNDVKENILFNIDALNVYITSFVVIYITFLLIGSNLSLFPVYKSIESTHLYKVIASKSVS